jgi:hypothetical protein
MITTDEIVAKAMQLSEKERASVAHQLLLSLDSEDVDEDDIASAWQKKSKRVCRKSRTASITRRTGERP